MEKKPYFSTRDLVVMAVLIAISGPFQFIWAHFVFNIGVLGPFTALFANAGFMVWCYIALYFVPKAGAATLVKFVGAIIEVMLGNPVGPVAIAYGAIEGIAVDAAFLLFRRKMTINMFIVGALFSQALTAPIDFVRDAVPFQLLAMVTYWAPGIAGTVFTGWFSSVILSGLQKAGIKPKPTPQ